MIIDTLTLILALIGIFTISLKIARLTSFIGLFLFGYTGFVTKQFLKSRLPASSFWFYKRLDKEPVKQTDNNADACVSRVYIPNPIKYLRHYRNIMSYKSRIEKTNGICRFKNTINCPLINHSVNLAGVPFPKLKESPTGNSVHFADSSTTENGDTNDKEHRC